MSRAVRQWLNTYPDKPLSKLDFEWLGEKSGLCISTIQAAYKTKQFIDGSYQAQYQFKLIYRVPAKNADERMSADEVLDAYGAWAEANADIAQVRYDMATQACDTRNTIQNVARDITDNQNAGTRAILDFLTQSKIQTLEADNQALRLAASQSAQNATLINALRPSPIPSYSVANPYCCNTNTCSGCGY